MDKVFDDFLKLLNTKREDNSEIDNEIKKFCDKYPDRAKMVSCDNDTFSSSYLLIFKESDQVMKIVFFDQHKNDDVVLNFSPSRLKSFLKNLSSF